MPGFVAEILQQYTMTNTTHTADWNLTNDHNLEILGNTDHPGTDPTACLVLLHGFKGYKDYGFIPVLAKALASAGILVHRFNSSTSGMTNDIDTFARPDLFALDTWNRQIEDVQCVMDAIQTGAIVGAGLPLFLAGHSRGGATTILTAGRNPSLNLSGIITINAVDRCCGLDEQTKQQLLNTGSMTTPSARTGQQLPINATWLQDQLDSPDTHDVLALCTTINAPALIMQGTDDPGVDIPTGQRIADAIGTDLHPIQGANHVLNMPNPAPLHGDMSPQLRDVCEQTCKFVIANRAKTPI